MGENFPRSLLTTEIRKLIKKELIINDNEFFLEKKENIVLPFMFWSGLTQKIPCQNIPHKKVNFSFNGNLRESQEPIASKAREYLETYGTCILSLHPSFGKTILGAFLAQKFALKTVIIVHRNPLVIQWKRTFTKFTTARIAIVGSDSDVDITSADVLVCMNTRYLKINPLEIGFVIFDEAHALCTPGNIEMLLYWRPAYILVETATLERTDFQHLMMLKIAGERSRIKVPFKGSFLVYKVNTPFIGTREIGKNGKPIWSVLMGSLLEKESRNEIILDIVRENLGEGILILTAYKKHVMLLQDLMTKEDIASDYLCGTKNQYQEGQVLIGTISKIGTGFDQANFCDNFSGKVFNVLIICSSIKKTALLEQNAGRIFRSQNPVIYHFVDDDGIIQNHWYGNSENLGARKWYLARGAEIQNY